MQELLSAIKPIGYFQQSGFLNNRIADISPLSALTKLTTLNLENNQIADLSPLQSLDRLDRVGIYGVTLPKKYFCHQDQWQVQWLLEEKNAEIRRLLIQIH